MIKKQKKPCLFSSTKHHIVHAELLLSY